jgi:hypothetical protein
VIPGPVTPASAVYLRFSLRRRIHPRIINLLEEFFTAHGHPATGPWTAPIEIVIIMEKAGSGMKQNFLDVRFAELVL